MPIDIAIRGGYPAEMPRTARASVGGIWYHALNRGNRREVVFHKPGDYDAFVAAMNDACARLPLDLLGYCVMPNHFHLVLRPRADGDLGRWMQWLLTAHARRYHRHYGTTGHIWQGRFKAFPVEEKGKKGTSLNHSDVWAIWATSIWGFAGGSDAKRALRRCDAVRCRPVATVARPGRSAGRLRRGAGGGGPAAPRGTGHTIRPQMTQMNPTGRIVRR